MCVSHANVVEIAGRLPGRFAQHRFYWTEDEQWHILLLLLLRGRRFPITMIGHYFEIEVLFEFSQLHFLFSE